MLACFWGLVPIASFALGVISAVAVPWAFVVLFKNREAKPEDYGWKSWKEKP